jgi:hypothetical protein
MSITCRSAKRLLKKHPRMARAVNDPEMSDRQRNRKRMVHRYSALGEFVQRLRSPRSLALLIAAAGGLALATPTAALASSGHHHAPQRDVRLNQVNLASDIPGMAPVTDPDLKNPWGVSLSPTSPLWVSNQGTDSSTQLR